MATTYVKRDPFARGEYRRESHPSGECDWCGSERKTLFSYTWESDDRPAYHLMDRKFCSLGCFEDYNS